MLQFSKSYHHMLTYHLFILKLKLLDKMFNLDNRPHTHKTSTQSHLLSKSKMFKFVKQFITKHINSLNFKLCISIKQNTDHKT